jgi:hypothetical protein
MLPPMKPDYRLTGSIEFFNELLRMMRGLNSLDPRELC